jgi:hypothetical protein
MSNTINGDSSYDDDVIMIHPMIVKNKRRYILY